MNDIKNKRLTLFLMEILLLQEKRCINEVFIEEINEFIYSYYEDNKELFSLLFNTNLLEQFIENNYQVLPNEILIGLIKKYRGFEGYGTLVDEIGLETDQKINILVTKFLEYYEELERLRQAKPITVYHRILQ